MCMAEREREKVKEFVTPQRTRAASVHRISW